MARRLLASAAAAVRRARTPMRRTRSSPSAPRCWTSRAASTPAATSRTPPTRRACAPRRRRSAAWCWPADAHHRGCWWSATGPRPGHALRRLPPEAARVRARRDAGRGRRHRSRCARSFTLGRVAAASFGPDHLTDHEPVGPPQAACTEGGRTALSYDESVAVPLPRSAPGSARAAADRRGAGLGLGGPCGAAWTRGAALPYAICRAFPALGVAGHAGETCGWAGLGGSRSRCSAAASMPTNGRGDDGMKGAIRTLAASACRCWCRPTPPAAWTPAHAGRRR